MKKSYSKAKAIVLVLFIITMAFSLASCIRREVSGELWEGATYKSDTTLGDGAKSVKVKISAGEESIVITIKTDKATLSEALLEHSLVNDESFFDTANGIKADWSKNQAWWGVYEGGKATSVGINELAATNGAEYELVYNVG